MDSKTVTFSINNKSIIIEVLTGLNLKKWKDDVMYAMVVVGIHTAMIKTKPTALTANSTEDQKLAYAAWERSDRLCLLLMKRSIPDHIKSILPTDCSAKEFLNAITLWYKISPKAEISMLLQDLFTMRYDHACDDVRSYIMRMIEYQLRLKALDVSLSDKFIVLHSLNTLPSEFSMLKNAYILKDETWSFNDLLSRAAVQEEKLRKEKSQTVLYSRNSNVSKGSGKKSKYMAHKVTQHITKDPGSTSNSMGVRKTYSKKDKNFLRCFFCKKMGHLMRGCEKYKLWLSEYEIQGIYKQEEAK